MDLDDVAGELYALPPDEFTAARTAKVTEARSSGDRQLASAISELRRPTTSAAIVNLLTRRRPDLIDNLLDLADDLRQAQTALAGDDLRRLSARRSRVVAALVEEGRRIAAEQQHPIIPQIENELSATLQAALADPPAAEWVSSGRLTSALRYSGFGTTPEASEPVPPSRRTQQPVKARRAAAPPPPLADEARSEQLARAKAAVTAAQGRLDELKQVASRAEDQLASTQARRQEAEEQITELERQLSEARDDERQAARDVRAQEKNRDKAVRAVKAARRRVEQAQQAQDRSGA